MQVTETLSQGLKREYDIFLPASDLADKLNGQLAELKSKAQIKGFRPGKVPVEHLRKIYGKSVMADVVQEAINSANKKIVDDNKLRLAREPKVELPTDQAAIEAALEARGDLTFKIALEVLPTFEIGDFSQIELERLTADVDDADVDDRARPARRRPPHVTSTRPEGAKAETHDRVTVDFDGKIDGEPFEGGEGRDIEVVLGSEHLHSRLRGRSSSASPPARSASFTRRFPRPTRCATLAGKTGEFDVTVKAVAAPEALVVDDEFAKGLGFESLDKLKEFMRERMAADYARVLARQDQAPAARQARRALHVRTARGPGEPGVRRHLGAGHAGAEGLRPQLRRREHDRGGRPRRLSQDRRAPRAPRAAAGRGRDQGRRQDLRRGDDARR